MICKHIWYIPVDKYRGCEVCGQTEYDVTDKWLTKWTRMNPDEWIQRVTNELKPFPVNRTIVNFIKELRNNEYK